MIDDETRERFLREIAAQVPADRIAELHLFRPLRRGATETGVAVIAVEQDDPDAMSATQAADDASTLPDDADAQVEDVAPAEVGGPESLDPVVVEASGDDDAATLGDSPYADDPAATSPSAEVELASPPVAHADAPDESEGDAPTPAESGAEQESPRRNLADVADLPDVADASAGAMADVPDVADAGANDITDAPVACATAPAEAADVSLARPKAARLVRHTVFTARYRLTRKGADRGKWEFEVVADADAPLGTVDMVVRGVQRRAGDDEEPERLTAEGVRAALDGQAWQRTT